MGAIVGAIDGDQVQSMQTVMEKARAVRLLVLDVDGVLTDGRLWYGNDGAELKAFDIQDGLGIKLLMRGGVDVAIITGRTSQLVARRGAELGIRRVVQGREDKLVALNEMCAELGIGLAEIAYMGDDLPDLSAIRAVGLGITVANGHAAVVPHAALQTRRGGGDGAVREICDLLLHAQGKFDGIVEHYLK